MIVKNITYTDFNNVERNEEACFNLSKTELMKMEYGSAESFSEMVRRIANAKDTAAIYNMFENIVLKSYGVKSADGRRLDKSEAVVKEFTQTSAYDVLMTELTSDTQAAVDFIAGILPSDMADAAREEIAKHELPDTAA